MRFLFHLAILAVIGALAAAAVVWGGLYDVSATDQHLRPTYRLLKIALERSVERRAKNIEVPALDSPERLRRGAELFAAHCVQCHGGPGVAPEPFALALRPLATPLQRTARDHDARYVYWIVKHGIKMTAMPAWEFRFSEDDTWSVVAFTMRIASLTPDQYAAATGRAPKTSAAPAEEKLTGEPDRERGRRALEQYACVSCHEIPGMVGAEARLGPTLHGIGSRGTLGGVLKNSPENMALWLRSPRSVAPGSAMPDLGVTARDARDMAAYLSTLQ
jgi:mono/diheme cytochrome c family protein